ncbi:4'-phosphopantetheinyl transferase family protein [Wenzhouxiangella limi]|uniref:4'-phosphopantetheinyl transferase family protein n=1 Tax=Wenzhouxiangella limi TaxID=2707351 RepID=UPI0019440BDF|nr:4'-phosphopantetheinyl transferase superfamily protein [Wenzhouxiangella limi]
MITVQLPLQRRPLPEPGLVDLWVSDLAAFPLAGKPGSPGQREQQQILKFRQRFLLRLLLGSYLDCPGKAVRFDRGPTGKPELIPALAAGGLRFNLSHSGDWLVVAVARHSAVGVDIERRRELPRAAALAQRFLSPAEARTVAALAEPARSECFLNLWSRREALVKARGGSVVSSLGDLELDPVDGQPRRLPADWPGAPEWTLRDPSLPAGLVGAVAVAEPGWSVLTHVLELGVP